MDARREKETPLVHHTITIATLPKGYSNLQHRSSEHGKALFAASIYIRPLILTVSSIPFFRCICFYSLCIVYEVSNRKFDGSNRTEENCICFFFFWTIDAIAIQVVDSPNRNRLLSLTFLALPRVSPCCVIIFRAVFD